MIKDYIRDVVKRKQLDEGSYNRVHDLYTGYLHDPCVFRELGIGKEYVNPSDEARKKIFDHALEVLKL